MKEKYLEDLKEIKDIMNRSSRFISLSGFSGISAGIIALIGAYLALDLATGTFLLAIASIIFFTTRKTLAQKQKIWDAQTRRLLINLFIPLLAGGLFCLILLSKGYLSIAAPLTLIFYGLALVNASKYTLNEVRSLGIIEIILGLFSALYTSYGLLFWAIGFGLMHIVYGIAMEIKYKS